jgi:protein tyrosine phosphatase (PTP) superfamily phosphohydrolase (DUF442 family)
VLNEVKDSPRNRVEMENQGKLPGQEGWASISFSEFKGSYPDGTADTPIRDADSASKDIRRMLPGKRTRFGQLRFWKPALLRSRRAFAVLKPSKRLCLGLLVAALFLAASANYVWRALDNFHEVLPGQLYRSGQLSRSHLQAHAHLNGIRTVINLRGPNQQEDWYREEIAAARDFGLVHVDLPIDSLFPTKPELCQVVDVLETCPKPVLIHCQSGIDRTGIASALACLLLDDTGTPEKALSQLNWRFGCLPGRQSREAKRDFLLAYASWLRTRHVEHNRVQLLTWLRDVIQIGSPDGKSCPGT